MSLTTRCPRCATVFELEPEQLQIRDGLVRCGECAAVFDGHACRVVHGASSAPVRATSTSPDANRRTAPITPPAVLRSRTSRGALGVDPVINVHQDVHRDEDGEEDKALPDPVVIADPHPYARSHVVPEFMDEYALARRRRARRLWGWAALLAVLMSGVQALWVFRVNVVTAAPMLRPAFESLCQTLGCTVGYERRIERLTIAASSLQTAHDDGTLKTGTDRLMLRVSLRNRALSAQPWPALMLELRDFADTVVVRRALLADEYLPETMSDRVLGAGKEVSLSIPLVVTGVTISGYQIDAFYP